MLSIRFNHLYLNLIPNTFLLPKIFICRPIFFFGQAGPVVRLIEIHMSYGFFRTASAPYSYKGCLIAGTTALLPRRELPSGPPPQVPVREWSRRPRILALLHNKKRQKCRLAAVPSRRDLVSTRGGSRRRRSQIDTIRKTMSSRKGAQTRAT